MVRIDRCLIDANWGSSTDVVYQFGQQISELAMQALGEAAMPFDRARMVGPPQGNLHDPAAATPAAAEYITLRKTSIYGGSNEIQKNIIAQGALGG